MADLAHLWSADLRVAPDGDLALSDGEDEARERVIRRLMTAAQEYVWQLDYGAGLPAWVGERLDPGRIAALVRQQMLLEPGILQIPEPEVVVSVGELNSVFVNITYASSEGARQSVSFGLSE